MDVPQQVGPAALLGAIIMVVGGVAIADQYSGESIAQRLVHDCFAPTPPQEVAFGEGAESPHVAVGPALTPAGFVGVDHWAGPDAVQYAGYRRLGPLRRAMDGPHAEAQLMHGVQIPLDAADGQPPLFPQRGDQAEHVDAEALLSHHHAVQLGWGQTATPTPGADPGHIDVLGNFRRNLGQLDDLSGAVGPTVGQLGSAVGTVVHGVLHPSGGCHAGAGKAVRPWLAGPFGRGGFPVGFGIGFEAGHPAGVRGFGRAFQLGNPFLQARNHRL